MMKGDLRAEPRRRGMLTAKAPRRQERLSTAKDLLEMIELERFCRHVEGAPKYPWRLGVFAVPFRARGSASPREQQQCPA